MRSLLLNLALWSFSLGCLSAAPVFSVVPGGDVTASVADFGSNVFFLDVRGTSFVGVTDGGFLGAFVLTTTGNPPFGNAKLSAVNFPAISESLSVAFDFAAPSVVGSKLFLNAILTPDTAITEPALAAFRKASPVKFGFTFSGTTNAGGAQLSTFSLDSIEGTNAVPEPASVAMMLSGGAFIYAVRRNRRA